MLLRLHSLSIQCHLRSSDWPLRVQHPVFEFWCSLPSSVSCVSATDIGRRRFEASPDPGGPVHAKQPEHPVAGPASVQQAGRVSARQQVAESALLGHAPQQLRDFRMAESGGSPAGQNWAGAPPEVQRLLGVRRHHPTISPGSRGTDTRHDFPSRVYIQSLLLDEYLFISHFVIITISLNYRRGVLRY